MLFPSWNHEEPKRSKLITTTLCGYFYPQPVNGRKCVETGKTSIVWMEPWFGGETVEINFFRKLEKIPFLSMKLHVCVPFRVGTVEIEDLQKLWHSWLSFEVGTVEMKKCIVCLYIETELLHLMVMMASDYKIMELWLVVPYEEKFSWRGNHVFGPMYVSLKMNITAVDPPLY